MYHAEYTPQALQDLRGISSGADRGAVTRRIKALEADPYHSKDLKYNLEGHRRVKAAGGRYRILFRIDEPDATIQIVLIGLRKPGDEQDAYERLRRISGNTGTGTGG